MPRLIGSQFLAYFLSSGAEVVKIPNTKFYHRLAGELKLSSS